MTNCCKENKGMVIHTDSFANERRFVCILKCRRTRQTRVMSGWTLLRCLKGNCLWVTDMWASHLLGPHVMDTKAGALRHRSIVLSGWSRVSDECVAPSHSPPPPQKRMTTIYVRASMFQIEISGGPNSSPAKSPFSTVPFRAQIAQIPNSPPTQAKF